MRLHNQPKNEPHNTPNPRSAAVVTESDEGDDLDDEFDSDPGNEDPGSQLDRDATVPLIDPDK